MWWVYQTYFKLNWEPPTPDWNKRNWQENLFIISMIEYRRSSKVPLSYLLYCFLPAPLWLMWHWPYLWFPHHSRNTLPRLGFVLLLLSLNNKATLLIHLTLFRHLYRNLQRKCFGWGTIAGKTAAFPRIRLRYPVAIGNLKFWPTFIAISINFHCQIN